MPTDEEVDLAWQNFHEAMRRQSRSWNRLRALDRAFFDRSIAEFKSIGITPSGEEPILSHHEGGREDLQEELHEATLEFFQGCYSALGHFAKIVTLIAPHDFKHGMRTGGLEAWLRFMSDRFPEVKAEIELMNEARAFRAKIIDHPQSGKVHDWMTYGYDRADGAFTVVPIWFVRTSGEIRVTQENFEHGDPYAPGFRPTVVCDEWRVAPPFHEVSAAIVEFTQAVAGRFGWSLGPANARELEELADAVGVSRAANPATPTVDEILVMLELDRIARVPITDANDPEAINAARRLLTEAERRLGRPIPMAWRCGDVRGRTDPRRRGLSGRAARVLAPTPRLDESFLSVRLLTRPLRWTSLPDSRFAPGGRKVDGHEKLTARWTVDLDLFGRPGLRKSLSQPAHERNYQRLNVRRRAETNEDQFNGSGTAAPEL